MFKPSIVIGVSEEACVGCRQCVNVCPSAALSMQDGKAVVEEPRCVGCMKCAEQCIPYGAIEIRPNPDGQQLGIPEDERDHAAANELCANARLAPEQVVCVCTGTTANEVAAAIVDGTTNLEDVTLAAGVRTVCGWLCLGAVIRLLNASGNPVHRPKEDYRYYPAGTEIAIWNIPDGVDEKYPEYRLKESLEAIEAGKLYEPAPWFADIQPGKAST